MNGNIVSIAVAVLPVVLIISAGWALLKIGLINEQGRAQLSKLVYWFALPCMLFAKLSQQDALGAIPWPAVTLVFGISGILVLVCMLLRGMPGPDRAACALISFRANGAFVGLPVVSFLVAGGVADESLQTAYLLLLAFGVPFNNALSVVALQVNADKDGAGQQWRRLPGRLATNPLILSSLAGVLGGSLGMVPCGNAVFRTIDTIGLAAVPLALIMAGASLRFDTLRQRALALSLSASAKLVLLPGLALLGAWCIGMSRIEAFAMCAFAAAPTAVAAVPMARELGGNERLSAAGVALTTVLSPFGMVLWLGLAALFDGS